MIRDRGSSFTAASGAVLAGAGIRTVLGNVRTPRMNAIAERWIRGCRRELPDRALIWNQHHLRRILRDYETQGVGKVLTGCNRGSSRHADMVR
jgi:putative transposase